MAFNTQRADTAWSVSAMATTSEGMVDGAVTTGTTRGLYTSLDAGQSWTYDALSIPGGATDATSATSVVYNAGAALVLRRDPLSRILFLARRHALDSTRRASPEARRLARALVRRSPLRTATPARFIVAKSRLCRAATRCMRGTSRFLRAGTSGRRRNVAEHERRCVVDGRSPTRHHELR